MCFHFVFYSCVNSFKLIESQKQNTRTNIKYSGHHEVVNIKSNASSIVYITINKTVKSVKLKTLSMKDNKKST